jgi:hypothetical protein
VSEGDGEQGQGENGVGQHVGRIIDRIDSQRKSSEGRRVKERRLRTRSKLTWMKKGTVPGTTELIIYCDGRAFPRSVVHSVPESTVGARGSRVLANH